jgi:hypothetical protein
LPVAIFVVASEASCIRVQLTFRTSHVTPLF